MFFSEKHSSGAFSKYTDCKSERSLLDVHWTSLAASSLVMPKSHGLVRDIYDLNRGFSFRKAFLIFLSSMTGLKRAGDEKP